MFRVDFLIFGHNFRYANRRLRNMNELIEDSVTLFLVSLYVCMIPVAIGFFWSHRRDCFACTYWQAWLRSCVLAYLITPSVVSDFWLFAFPGPAALGFALVFPGVLTATGERLDSLLLILFFYVLPWLACTALVFYLWRFIRWLRMSGG